MTAAPGPAVPIPALREAARRRVAATSLRTVAREVGMSPSALGAFLEGSEPRTGTLRRLRAWHLALTGEGGAGPPPETLTAGDARAALAVLLRGTPGERWAEGVREAVRILRAALGGGEPPRWLEELSRDPPPPPVTPRPDGG